MVDHGFDLAYNLDHEQAIDVLKQAAAQDPASSAPSAPWPRSPG